MGIVSIQDEVSSRRVFGSFRKPFERVASYLSSSFAIIIRAACGLTSACAKRCTAMTLHCQKFLNDRVFRGEAFLQSVSRRVEFFFFFSLDDSKYENYKLLFLFKISFEPRSILFEKEKFPKDSVPTSFRPPLIRIPTERSSI